MSHFEQYIKELSAARSRDESFEHSAAELMEKLGKVSDQQLSALSRIQSEQEQLIRTSERFTSHSQGVSDAMKQSAAELSSGCQRFTQNVVSGLSQSLGMFDASMHSLMTMMSETTDKLSGAESADTTRQACETQRLLTALTESINQATAALRQKEG